MNTAFNRPLKLAAIIGFLFFSISICLQSLGTASALTERQRLILNSGIYYYNSEGTTFACGPGGGGGGELTGSDNAEKIWNYFINKGYTPEQTAGIIGNMQAESAVETTRLQNTRPGVITRAQDAESSRLGWGLVQWTPAGKMITFSRNEGTSYEQIETVEHQVDFLWRQLEGQLPGREAPNEKSAGDHLKQQTTVAGAAASFMTKYERPRDTSDSKVQGRVDLALDIMVRYGSITSSTGSGNITSSSCATNSDGETVDGLSLPVDRKWYDDHKVWFTKTHHDYPASDIPVPTGTPIYSMTAGTVIKAPVGGACGTGIIIDNPEGVRFTYCHGSDGGSITGARTGDTVQPGQLIMHSASTGRSTGPHLHLDIKVGGGLRCPQNLFVGIAEGSPPSIESLPSSGCSH